MIGAIVRIVIGLIIGLAVGTALLIAFCIDLFAAETRPAKLRTRSYARRQLAVLEEAHT